MARSQPGQESLVRRAQDVCGKVPGAGTAGRAVAKLPFFTAGETPDILTVLMASENRTPPQMSKGCVASFSVEESSLALAGDWR